MKTACSAVALFSIALFLYAGIGFAEEIPKPGQQTFPNENAEMSYSIGLLVGKKNSTRYSYLETQAFLDGIRAGLDGNSALMTETEAKTFMIEFMKNKKLQGFSSATREDGIRYLEMNAKREGVTVTETGLQYEVLKAGEGQKPGTSDTVKVHYRGALINGYEFDSSYKRHTPAEFKLRQVIDGWTEGLQLMSPGSKYRFVIPASLAYGESRTGGAISPGSTLVFEVELLEVL